MEGFQKIQKWKAIFPGSSAQMVNLTGWGLEDGMTFFAIFYRNYFLVVVI
ncbi:MAG: hypothetical protein LUF86_03620 [Clostridiales bacterium]|nr:hypothetical protein [Clostridiales bacterium]